VQRILDSMGTPALVRNARCDYLAANRWPDPVLRSTCCESGWLQGWHGKCGRGQIARCEVSP
jgi:hypothetical protein